MARATEVSNLDCRSSVERGAWLVLEARFREMLALKETALDFSDPEGVHDMRVASRRLRGALRDFVFLFGRKRFKRLNKDLKNVAAALGGVRDEDVALIALDTVAKKAPEQVTTGIKRFADERRRARDAARKHLVEALSPLRLAQLEAKFTVALAPLEANTNDSEEGNGQPPAASTQIVGVDFRQSGHAVIARCFEDARELSRSLYHPLQPEPLHELRIAAKRLRYALELFAVCWGNDVILPFAKEVAGLQSSLGELHDADEWIVRLGQRLETDALFTVGKSLEQAAAETHQENRRAALWLLQYFLKERTKHYHAALMRWHEWETSNFAGRLAEQLQAQSS